MTTIPVSPATAARLREIEAELDQLRNPARAVQKALKALSSCEAAREATLLVEALELAWAKAEHLLTMVHERAER